MNDIHTQARTAAQKLVGDLCKYPGDWFENGLPQESKLVILEQKVAAVLVEFHKETGDELDLSLPDDTLRLGIGFLGIGARTKNALRKAGIVDVEQCIAALKCGRKIPGMAKVCSDELRLAITVFYQQIGVHYPIF